MRRWLLPGIVLSSCLTFTAMLPKAPYAQASNGRLRCGALVTTDIKLESNLLDCKGDGLTVDSNNITINLDGHLIGSDAVPGSGQPDVGILIAGHSGVTVTGGSISGFDVGVLLEGASDNRLLHLRIHGTAGKGIILTGAPYNVIAHNTLSQDSDAGIGVFDGSDHNVISRNYLTKDGPQGIENLFADWNIITRNRITRTGSGVILESSNDLHITHNRITHSLASACDGCGIAIQIYGNHNLVARNRLIDSPRYGIEVDDFQDPGHSPARGNVLWDNRISVAGEGIAVGPEAGGVVLHTLIQHNVVSNAGDDGIQLIGPSTGLQTSILGENIAVHNGDFGIETVPGTIDAGGNKAAGNGNALQCLNITCR